MLNQAFSIKNLSQHVIGITSVSDEKKNHKNIDSYLKHKGKENLNKLQIDSKYSILLLLASQPMPALVARIIENDVSWI